jgi:hypothetical protein
MYCFTSKAIVMSVRDGGWPTAAVAEGHELLLREQVVLVLEGEVSSGGGPRQTVSVAIHMS